MMNFIRIITLLVLALVPCAGKALAAQTCIAQAVAGEQVLGTDDLGGAGLAGAVQASLGYLNKIPASRRFKFCDREFTAADLKGSLNDFARLWQQLGPSREFYRQLAARFEFLAARRAENEAGAILATGYFEPLVEGSLQRRPPFIYPLYRVPDDLVRRDGTVGRLVNGRLVPYWTRGEIEEGNLLAGRELVYLNDPVAAFILQVQGSGRVRLRDGTIRPVLFAAKNGRPYRSIGRILVERGKMSLAQVNLPAIIAYLKDHPEQRCEILRQNESFVFFRWGKEGTTGPLGNLGEPLGAGRSVALDQECYPPGALAWLQTRRPIFNGRNEVVGWEPLHRLVLNQDTGSAIRGPGRLDLFLGHGDKARITAGLMKTPGRLFLLVRKN